jgi:hypothetical protein
MAYTDRPEHRRFVRRMFGSAEEQQTKRNHSVPGEGNNPPAAISGEARARDFVRRFFGDVAAYEVPLPPEDTK